MAMGIDASQVGGSLPSRRMPTTCYRRDFLTSNARFPAPAMEESQFFVKLSQDSKEKLQIPTKDEGELVTLLLQTDRLVMVWQGRSWEWNLGCVRRYGHSQSDFYFESGRKSTTGPGLFTFDTDQGERIHTKVAMMKEFCQFDLYCQRGILPDLHLTESLPSRAASFKTRSERLTGPNNKEPNVRRTSTGSLP